MTSNFPSPQPQPQPYLPPQPQPYPPSYGAQMTPPYYPNPNNPDDSVGSWVLALFVVSIPLVGFIYLLVLAFGGGASVSRRNWARATLIWMLIGLAITILIMIIMGIAGITLFSNLQNVPVAGVSYLG